MDPGTDHTPQGAFPLLRWLLGKAAEGLPLTDRHYIVPRLVTEAVELFGWREDLVGTLTRKFDVFPLQTIRQLATREMKAIHRTSKQLVLTPLGRRMVTDDDQLWDTAISCLHAPFALTPDGVTAAKAALRAHALRPRFTLGFG